MSLNDKDKKRVYDNMLSSLKKKWGDNVISIAASKVFESISTGSPMLDAAITGSGYAEGRFIEIWGDESSGKTTTACIMMKCAQEKYPDKLVGFVDVEHAFNPEYAGKLGLDTSDHKFVFAQPNSAEEALEILLHFVESGLFSVVCFDSVGGLVTKSQLERGIDEETMGAVARVLSKSASRINMAAESSNTTVIWINQTRNKIVLMGNPETTTGGKTLPFFHSTRVKVRRTGIVTEKDVPIGQEVEYKIIKNKVGTPFGVVNTTIFFGKGFDDIRETVEVGIKKKVLSSAGAWTYLHKGEPNEQKWNGKLACIQHYRDNPDEYAILYGLVMGNNENAVDIDVSIANEVDTSTGLKNSDVQEG